MDTLVLADQQKLTFISFCVDSGCCLENLSRVMSDRDRERERERERIEGICGVKTP